MSRFIPTLLTSMLLIVVAFSEEVKANEPPPVPKSASALREEIRYGNWALSFDRQSGSWLELRNEGKVLFQAGESMSLNDIKWLK